MDINMSSDRGKRVFSEKKYSRKIASHRPLNTNV